MADNTIKIKFISDGDKGLVKAIEKLDLVHKKLTQAQENLIDVGKKGGRANVKSINTLRKYNELLKKNNLTLKDIGINSFTYSTAIRGNQLALEKVKVATMKHTKSMKKQQKGMFETAHSTRILGGSFAVLRSKLLLASFAGTLVASTIGRLARQFGVQEDAERDLSSQLGHTNKELLNQASALQNMTTHGDESLLQIMRFASTLGIQERDLVKTTKASIGLSEAYGIDLRQSTRMLALATSGNTEMLNRYIPELRNAKTETEKLDIISRKATEGFQLHIDKTGGLNFALDQMNNSIGDVAEKLGGELAPLVILVADGLKAFANGLDTARVTRLTTAIEGMTGAFILYRIGVTGASVATLGFAKALTSTGAGAIVTIFGTLAMIAMELAGAFEVVEESTEDLNEETKTNNKLTKEQITNIEKILEIEQKRKKSIDEKIMALALEEAELKGVSAMTIMEIKFGFEFVSMNKKRIESLIESRKRVKDLKEEKKDAVKEEQFERREKIKLQKEIEAIQKDIDKDEKNQNKKRIEEQKANDLFERTQKIKLANDLKAISKEIENDEKKSLKNQEAFSKNQKQKIANDLKKIQEQIRDDEAKSLKDEENFSRNQKRKIADDLKAIGLDILNDEKEENRKKQEEQSKQNDFERKQKIKLAEDIANIEAEIRRDEIKRLQDVSNAKKIIFQDDIDFQMKQVELEADRYRKLLESAEERDALDAWEKNQKITRAISHLEEESTLFNAGLDSYDAFVQGIMDQDMNMLDTREAVLNAFKESAIKFVAEMIKEKIKQAIADTVIRKSAEKTAVVSAKQTGAQILTAYAPSAVATSTATFGASAVAGQVAMGASYASLMGLQMAENGGFIGGNPHSQGGTLIEAEKGEFIMSKNAVDSIGLNNLSEMNSTGKSSVTVNIKGNILGTRGFVRDVLIPEIDKAVRRGLA